MIASDTDPSLKWCSTPPPWHINAVGGVHPIINRLARYVRLSHDDGAKADVVELRMWATSRHAPERRIAKSSARFPSVAENTKGRLPSTIICGGQRACFKS